MSRGFEGGGTVPLGPRVESMRELGAVHERFAVVAFSVSFDERVPQRSEPDDGGHL